MESKDGLAVVAFPVLVTGGIEKTETLSADQIMQQLDKPGADQPADAASAPESATKEGELPNPAADSAKEDDPMKAMLEDAEKEAKKKK